MHAGAAMEFTMQVTKPRAHAPQCTKHALSAGKYLIRREQLTDRRACISMASTVSQTLVVRACTLTGHVGHGHTSIREVECRCP